MSWLFEKRTYSSDYNGSIYAVKICGVWNLYIHSIQYLGSYLRTMWEYALSRCSRSVREMSTPSIVCLGLGAGQQIKTYHSFFKDPRLTIVEIDPMMVRITHELGIYQPHQLPHIIIGDAGTVVTELTGTFDLVVIDLFDGSIDAERVEHTTTVIVRQLPRLLNPTGQAILNMTSKGTHFLEVVAREIGFSVEQIQYKSNALVILTKDA